MYRETRQALDAIGDDDKVICWVSTGRGPHRGDSMPARDLEGILRASQQVGLQRFLYHSTGTLGAAERRVLSGMCGTLWKDDPEGYWPAVTPKPGSF